MDHEAITSDGPRSVMRPSASWPHHLKGAFQIVTASPTPMAVLWGSELVLLFNQAFFDAMGQTLRRQGVRADLAWPRIWEFLGPQARGALEHGASGWRQLPLVVDRSLAGTRYTFGLSVIRDDDDVPGGVFITCHCATDQATNGHDDVAMLAHELRNPLAPLQIALHILRQRELPTDAYRHIEVAQRQVASLTRLVSDLLDFSRLSHGKVDLERRTLDVGTVVRGAVDSIRETLSSNQRGIAIHLPDRMLFVRADPMRLEQILVNLLTNAVKFTQPGGHIWLRVATEWSDRGRPMVVIRIRDDGAGIPTAQQARLFNLFEQGDGSSARSQGGLGIGLAIVKHLVELHGGDVSVASDGPGTGSEFTVRLPEVGEPSREVDLNRHTNEEPIPPLRVLVVDDDRDMAEMLAELLAVAGHHPHVAHDGPEAVRTAARVNPDVVFLDLDLPTMSGVETATKLSTLQPRPHLVALTGRGHSDDIRETRSVGFSQHIVKPPAISEVFGALRDAVSHRRRDR